MAVSPPCKKVGNSTYHHHSALPLLSSEEQVIVDQAVSLLPTDNSGKFNILRFSNDLSSLSLLNYKDFHESPFPALLESWKYKPDSHQLQYRNYKDSINPPILHRKELLLGEKHPRYQEYAALTEAAETIGLFDEPTKIGFQRQWQQLIREKGYRLEGHQLIPIANDEDTFSAEKESIVLQEWNAARHLTAMVRYGFSAPIQTLARNGYIDEGYTFFDYGCGRGSDVRGLVENGLSAAGWDPYYAQDNEKRSADIVNLGFVVNVIESMDERIDALLGAYALADQFIVVSVMLENANRAEGQQFRDGVLTKRGTFQKYYSQGEIKQFIEEVLDEEAIAVAPGIHYVFKDKEAEQRFLSNRFRSRKNQLRRPSRATPEQLEEWRAKRAENKYEEYSGPLERLWLQWLTLGRQPDKSECADLAVLSKGFKSFNRALRFLEERKDLDLVEWAAQSRMEDLEVLFALNLFQKREPYKRMDPGLKRDINFFFGNYTQIGRAHV